MNYQDGAYSSPDTESWRHLLLKERAARDLAAENGDSAFGMLREVLEAATVIEVSEPLDYFLRRTPDEESFTIREFPNVTPASTAPLFLEGRAPVPSGSAVGALVFRVHGDGGSEQTLEDISPRRIGYLVRGGVFEKGGEPPWWPSGGVLMVELSAFIERADGQLDKPPLVWQLPLDARGAVLPVDSDDGLPMLITDPDLFNLPATELQGVTDALSEAYRSLLFCGLFTLSAMNAHRGGRALCKFEESACGREGEKLRKLSTADLEEHLEGRARATEIGLGHALTVCREDFRG